MGEIWFENINGEFQAPAPQGQEEGELLTVELILGPNSPYDATASRHMGNPVIAYIYEWNMTGVIPAGTEGEEDEDEAAASDDGWWTGTDTEDVYKRQVLHGGRDKCKNRSIGKQVLLCGGENKKAS